MTVELAIQDWHWEVTKNCNLKCLHCILGDRSGYEMNTKEALAAVSRIVELGGRRLFITGGEPLVRNDICSIIKRAYEAGLEVSLISNGTRVSKTFLGDLGSRIQNIAISIDGLPLVQDKIRGAGSFDKCVSAIRLMSESGIDVSVYSTINSLNETAIGEFVEKLVPLGVKNFHFNEINPDGRARKNDFLLLPPRGTKERANSILLQLKEIIEIDCFEVSTSCSISPRTVYMRSDGTIFSCVELAFKNPPCGVANILEENFRRIKEGLKGFFAMTRFCENTACCYTSFSSSGISVNLNEAEKCRLIRRIDNES